MFLPDWPKSNKASGKIVEILELLGNPHLKLPDIIHVTGTNGKGSTISFLKQIFMQQGYQTHCFTSPHLLNFNENFVVSNKLISDKLITELTNEIRSKLEGKIMPGFFEYQCALAFLAFSRNKADICLIECGMGAKNDPTNIFKNKFLNIITSIDQDHEEFIGPTIKEITFEKAHIMGECTTICAPQNSISQEILNDFSAKLPKSIIVNHKEDYDFNVVDNKLSFIDKNKKETSYYDLPSLQGAHQIINLATALSAIKNQTKFSFDDDVVNQAIQNAFIKGRLEKIDLIDKSFYPKDCEIYFDGAHNKSGAHALKKWLDDQSDGKRNLIIYGRSKNKNHEDFLKPLNDDKNEIIFVTVKNEALPETSYSFEKFQSSNPDYKNIKIMDDLETVFLDHLPLRKEKLRIIICGSLFLYRDVDEMF